MENPGWPNQDSFSGRWHVLSKIRDIYCFMIKKERKRACKWRLVCFIAAVMTGCTVYKINVNADLMIPDKEEIPKETY